MFALRVSPQPHPSNASLLTSSLQLVTHYLISAAIKTFHLPNQSNPWSCCLDLHCAYSQLLLIPSTHCTKSKLKTVSTAGQSSHHVWYKAHPPPQCLQTLWMVISILTAQRMKGPQSSGLIRFEIQGKTSTGINTAGWSRKALILKVMLRATWSVCIFSMVRDSILQIEILKPTNHFNKSCETPPATLIRKLPVTKNTRK